MIIDRVENAHLYYGLGKHIDTALDYLEKTDLSGVTRVTLDDGAVRIGCVEYVTRPLEKCNCENHLVDADIHVCLEGVEVIGYCTLKNAAAISEYDPSIDKQFFHGPMNYIRLTPGMFALMLTDDVHAAMAADGNPAPAKKLIIKCKLGGLYND